MASFLLMFELFFFLLVVIHKVEFIIMNNMMFMFVCPSFRPSVGPSVSENMLNVAVVEMVLFMMVLFLMMMLLLMLFVLLWHKYVVGYLYICCCFLLFLLIFFFKTSCCLFAKILFHSLCTFFYWVINPFGNLKYNWIWF